MSKAPDSLQPQERLRTSAESKLREVGAHDGAADEVDPALLLHELQVHQIELEMQNEELRRAYSQLDASRQQYVDLYNHAPVGYASLDESGLILRVNATLCELLGNDVDRLRGRALVEFVEPADVATFRGRFRSFGAKPAGKHMDLKLRRRTSEGVTPFVGRLHARRIDGDSDPFGGPHLKRAVLLVAVADVTALKETEAQLQHHAYHDPLTGLPNRRSLYDRVDAAIAQARRHARFGALLFLDVDRFKKVNDSLGHHAGDHLLVELSKRLRDNLRREDMLARLGGDEFVVLLAEQHADRNLMAVNTQRFAEHLLGRLGEPVAFGDRQIPISLSVGVTIFPFAPQDGAGEVLGQADLAMYRAKVNRRSQVCFFHASMQTEARRRLEVEIELRSAISQDQLVIHYQPQVSPEGRIRAIEALVRWQHPERGLLPPMDFIPIAEETGLIVPLGEWVLEKVARQMAEWAPVITCGADRRMSINVSARQLTSEGFHGKALEILARLGIPLPHVMFEITESLLLPGDAATRDELVRLSDSGAGLSLDDFGTGYSSLSVLQNLPIGQIKIDRSFVKNLHLDSAATSPRAELAMVRAMVSLAHSMGLSIVAEGVDDFRQRDLLIEMGCDLMQGNLFSPAIPGEAMTRLLLGDGVLQPRSHPAAS